MNRLTLLPCPFCGEPPREHYGEHSEEHWVACESESCDVCPTTSGGSIESARRAWNRRQSLSQEAESSRGASELIEELEKLGIPAGDWDGDDGLWPTLAKCIKNYCEEQTHYHAEGLKLDQEAVRDEALREAVKRYLKEQGDESWWTASERRLAIALKREPNAAGPSKVTK